MTHAYRRMLILAALREYPGSTVKEVAQRLNMDALRVAQMLRHLEAYGVVEGALPPLMTRGKRYRVAEAT